ncbi:MAG: hypothetical protein JW703_04085 [Candidatus Diapherotrites archaeon]|nr:hypothetical protein [Candidatus Diapherotrites archaeon]
MLGLSVFSIQAEQTKETLSDQIVCESLAQAMDYLWLKEGASYSFFLSSDANVFPDRIELTNAVCFPSSKPNQAILTAGNITISFSGGELIASN